MMHPRAAHQIAFNPTLPTTAKTINIFSTTRDRPINSSPFPATGRVGQTEAPSLGEKCRSHTNRRFLSLCTESDLSLFGQCVAAVCMCVCVVLLLCVLYYFSVYEAIFLLFCQKMVQKMQRRHSFFRPFKRSKNFVLAEAHYQHESIMQLNCSFSRSGEETEFLSAKERQQKRRLK